jgi:hypothetical protein
MHDIFYQIVQIVWMKSYILNSIYILVWKNILLNFTYILVWNDIILFINTSLMLTEKKTRNNFFLQIFYLYLSEIKQNFLINL